MRYLILVLFVGLAFGQLPWPFPPQDSVHPLGNAWGSYQDYGGTPYCHNGADIMSPPLWPVTVIKDGYVKAIFQSGNPYNGIIVADSAGAAFCDGFMYYHVDNTTMRVQ